MSKKLALRMLGIIGVVGIGFLAVAECRPGTATAFNFWRVEPGMSKAEVEAILGPGAGLHDGEPTKAAHRERLIVPGQSAVETAGR